MARIGLRGLRWAVVVVVVGAALPAAAAAAAETQPLGHACVLQSTGVRYCPTPVPTSDSDQRVRSWDGAPLQVNVTLPRTGAGPWPTIVMLPGYGGSDGVSWEASEGSSGSNYGNDFSNVGFAKQGYAVVTMNFRGVGYSCGPVYAQSPTNATWKANDVPACRNVSFEFADQRYDARDVQWVLGLLVDEGIARPRALGVAGESLGSLVTNELALLFNRVRLPDGRFRPWTSPSGVPLRIGAAYPIWALADLADAAAPNGRFLSSRPRTAIADADPVGSIKLTVPMSIAATAPVYTKPTPSRPGGFSLFADTTYAVLAAPDGPAADAVVSEIRDYHQAVGMPIGSGVAPILMHDGWGDLLVNGASQGVRLAAYLKTEAPRAKVALQFADAGHPLAGNKRADLEALTEQGFAFFDHYLQGAPGGPAPGSVTAFTSTCPTGAPSAGPYVAKGMTALAPGRVRFSSAPPQTVVGGGDPSIGVALDPILNTVSGGHAECRAFAPGNWPGTAVYTHPVARTFTTLGLPTMRMRIATIGAGGQLNARLWDVHPDGSETYVSRGTYALGDDQTGTIEWQMWGAGYEFVKGDTIRVELLAQDVPLQRPSREPFAVTVSDFTLELPVRR
jgi:hypothetical protein